VLIQLPAPHALKTCVELDLAAVEQ